MRSDYHHPVMLESCLEWLITSPSGRYLDATLGGGGHSAEILNRLAEDGRLDSFDRDPDAIAEATARLGGDRRIAIHHRPFAELGELIPDKSLSGVLMDLGISSHQVDAPERGFSFRLSQNADLRMNRGDEQDAADWIRENGSDALARALIDNADLRPAKRAAQWLATAVENDGVLKMSAVLAAAKFVAGGGRHDDVAARILQALRMEVNDELGQLERGLEAAHRALKSGGRLVVLSYHSVEDRCVKQAGQQWMRACICPTELPVCVCGGDRSTMRALLKTPGRPTPEEERDNPRSRSAKLRVYEKR